MELVMGPRCSGKTTIIEERVRETLYDTGEYPIVIVPRASHGDRWHRLGVRKQDIVLASAYANVMRGIRDRRVFVDDLDLVIAEFIREPIECASMTVSGPTTILPGLR